MADITGGCWLPQTDSRERHRVNFFLRKPPDEPTNHADHHAPTMRHLHYFDPQLVDLSGHYHTYCEHVVKEMKRRNIPVTIYARKGCQVSCAGLTRAAILRKR